MELEALRKDMVAAMKAKDKSNKGCSLFPDFRSEEGGNRRRLP